MKYLCLLYESESLWNTMSQQETEAIFAEHMTFNETYKGKIIGGEPLEPTNTATTVRVRNGKVSTTDGPYAETKEQLGGYYLIEATDLNEAIQIAAKIPDARLGCVEVRPVMPIPVMDEAAVAAGG